MQKPWEGRFKEKTEKLVEKFTQSVSFDKRLALQDIRQSIAHVKALSQAGVITKEEEELLVSGLLKLKEDVESGKMEFLEELEDVHMNIERALTEKVGEVGGKVHTARSRNDQVATDERLFLKEEIEKLQKELKKLRIALVELAEKTVDVLIPSYTHLQRAQPIRLAHYFLAHREALLTDSIRFANAYRLLDSLPLGSGASAGVDFPIDRFYIAKELGFRSVIRNSLYATAERDFILDVLYACAVCGMHLSRLSEDLIIWSSEEFGFVSLPDRFCTGSSIMPQKKNPDVLELIRGKTGRLYGNLISLLTTLKGLPYAYNRDLQEDKEPLFDSIDTLKSSLEVMALLLKGLQINEERTFSCAGSFTLATDLANYLVLKGLPFRQAHKVVGSLVGYLLEKGKRLEEVSLEELKEFSELFDESALKLLDPRVCADRRKTYGGTSKEQVFVQIENAKREEGLL
ncbi:argininosuccinate lyase [Thermocrinis sp.]|uniref:argininosuccinate lyase n=1 Tax=Thermocrinis sp. TaxID=2024383 RepID=UPI002FDED641